MITVWLQSRLDLMRVTSAQRWVSVVAAVGAVVLALATIGIGSGRIPAWAAVFVVATAVNAAARPASHAGAFAATLVVLEWLAVIDDVTSPRSVAVALCLFAFHTLLALMAVTPHSAVIDQEVLRRWARRSLGVSGATIAVWVVVVALDGRNASGSAGLSLAAFLILTAAALGARARTLSG